MTLFARETFRRLLPRNDHVNILAWTFSQASSYDKRSSSPVNDLLGISLSISRLNLGIWHVKEGGVSIWTRASAGEPVIARRTSSRQLVRIPPHERCWTVKRFPWVRVTLSGGGEAHAYRQRVCQGGIPPSNDDTCSVAFGTCRKPCLLSQRNMWLVILTKKRDVSLRG